MIEKIMLCITIIFVLLFLFVYIRNSRKKFFVYRIVDGDTIHARRSLKSKKYIKVRLIGINAPESKDWGAKRKEEFGTESKEFLKKLLPIDSKIELEYDKEKIDKFERHLCYLYKDGTFINEFIAKKGFAKVFTVGNNNKYEDILLKAEKYAKFNELGIFQK